MGCSVKGKNKFIGYVQFVYYLQPGASVNIISQDNLEFQKHCYIVRYLIFFN